MNALIVDDERLARRELRRLLEENHAGAVTVVGEAANATEARREIERLRPDLVFLDVEMPEGGGFHLLESLPDPPRVIFVTAYEEHALRAFEFHAFDYLLKPIDPARLAESLAHLGREVRPAARADLESPVLGEDDHVFVKDEARCHFVRVRDIRLLESEGNYARLFFNGQRALVGRSLNALEARLDPRRFFRASRRHLINLRWVEKIEPLFHGGLLVRLEGGLTAEMSRRQAQRFRELRQL